MMEELLYKPLSEAFVSAAALEDELAHILNYWKNTVVNKKRDGFYGAVSYTDIPDPDAPLGIVMYSRLLWSFSAAASFTGDPEWRSLAGLAYTGIADFFEDKEWGGVFWSVSPDGRIMDDRKQLYGIAFCIYGLSEYYSLTRDSNVLAKATTLYRLIEHYGFDTTCNGYVEAFTRDWKEISDMRLSEKDQNERKTMNTHLHIVEAYANLYAVWPDQGLKERIQNLLFLFDARFIDPETGHLNLFFNDQWDLKSRLISYGHDIEAAWLLAWCAGQIGDTSWLERINNKVPRIADAAARGLDGDGGLWYEFEPETHQLVMEKHAWPQAEALLGFYHAWTVTGDEKYLRKLRQCWSFIQQFIKDKQGGEWFWGVYGDYSVMKKDKAGFWKCPYHNTRAVLGLLKKKYS